MESLKIYTNVLRLLMRAAGANFFPISKIRKKKHCQSVPVMILKLLPIDSSDVREPENYPQRMLEVHRK